MLGRKHFEWACTAVSFCLNQQSLYDMPSLRLLGSDEECLTSSSLQQDVPQRLDIFDGASSVHQRSHDQTAEQILNASCRRGRGGQGAGGVMRVRLSASSRTHATVTTQWSRERHHRSIRILDLGNFLALNTIVVGLGRYTSPHSTRSRDRSKECTEGEDRCSVDPNAVNCLDWTVTSNRASKNTQEGHFRAE